MQKFFSLTQLTLLVLIIAGCSTDGAKKNIEFQLNRDIGKLPNEAFKSISKVECKNLNGEPGCLRVDEYYGCRIWYKLEKISGRISSWEYVGRPENCWGYHGH